VPAGVPGDPVSQQPSSVVSAGRLPARAGKRAWLQRHDGFSMEHMGVTCVLYPELELTPQHGLMRRHLLAGRIC